MSNAAAARSPLAIPEILSVTFRQLLGRRRTILLALLCAVPILLALVTRAASGGDNGIDVRDFVRSIYDAIAVTILLPIVAVLIGTGAFGAEIEDGTIVYLLAKPVSRWRIVVAKFVAAAGFTAIMTVLSVTIAGAIALLTEGDAGVSAVKGFALAMAVGSICYCAVFITLSLFTRRALLIGIGYILIWEGTLATLLPGIANLSIRQYVLGASTVAYDGIPTRLTSNSAFIFAGVVVVIAVALAIWKLRRFELPSTTD